MTLGDKVARAANKRGYVVVGFTTGRFFQPPYESSFAGMDLDCYALKVTKKTSRKDWLEQIEILRPRFAANPQVPRVAKNQKYPNACYYRATLVKQASIPGWR